MSKSDYLENKLLDHVLGGPDYARPATVYLALFSAAPTDVGGGTELAGNGYARVAVTNNSTNFPAAAGGSKSNGVEIAFAAATADWVQATHFAYFDAAAAGNMLRWGALDNPVTAHTGESVKFPAGTLVATED